MTGQSVANHADGVVYKELRRMGGLLEALTSELRSNSRAVSGDTKAMAQNAICRNILGVCNAWLWETDNEQKFIYVSPQFSEAVADDPMYFIGKTRQEIGRQCSIAGIELQSHAEVLKRKVEFRDYVYPADMPNAGRRWFKVSGRPRFDIGTNEFLGYWGMAFDYTPQREAEMEETRKLAEFGMTFDALDVSILMLTSQYTISYFNEHWRELHASMKESEFCIGTKFRDYLTSAVRRHLFPDAFQREEEFIDERIQRNINPPQKPFTVRRQDGIRLSIKVSKLKNGGRLIVSSSERDDTIYNKK